MAAHRRTRQDKSKAQFRRQEEPTYQLSSTHSNTSRLKRSNKPVSSTQTLLTVTDLLRYDIRFIGQDFIKTAVVSSSLALFLLFLFARQQGWLPW